MGPQWFLQTTSLLFIYYNALILNHLANGHKFRVIFGLEFDKKSPRNLHM